MSKIYNNSQLSNLVFYLNMVRTNSISIPLGTKLPEFQMLNVNTKTVKPFNISFLDERDLLIMFICAHCPFVKYIENEISRLSQEIEDYVQIIAVSSNDAKTYPDDSPENLRNQSKRNKWKFPYLYDEDQSFAKQLRAACTPDFYLFCNFDKDFSLFYHGQLDSSRPSNNIPPTSRDLLMAIQAMRKEEIYTFPIQPSLGCNIKWKLGAEPSWFK